MNWGTLKTAYKIFGVSRFFAQPLENSSSTYSFYYLQKFPLFFPYDDEIIEEYCFNNANNSDWAYMSKVVDAWGY